MHYVYMLTNKWHTVLYTGMTDSLDGRLSEHKNGLYDGFTKRYNCKQLVYYEALPTADAAAQREKQLKGWTRARKNALIESANPNWDDLSSRILRE